MTIAILTPAIVNEHFNVGNTVRILPYNGFPPRLHAGKMGIVRRVLKLYDYVERCHIYDYWIEFGDGEAWLYSESALEAV